MSTVSLSLQADVVTRDPVHHHPDGCSTQVLRLYRHGVTGPALLVSLVWTTAATPDVDLSFSPPHRGPLD